MSVIKVIKGDKIDSIMNTFFKALIDNKAFSELLVPVKTGAGTNVVPTLVHEMSELEGSEHLSPVINGSSATHLVQLTEESSDRKLAAVLRPCEARAVVELTKLKQVISDDLLVISHGCNGTVSLRNYAELLERGKTNEDIIMSIMKDRFAPVEGDIGIREACKLCSYRISPTADINMAFAPAEGGWVMLAIGQTEKGDGILGGLDIPDGKPSEEMQEMMKKAAEQTENFWKEISPELDKMTGNLEDLNKALDLCIRCYNCMSMCPICYCKECFFKSAPVTPSPSQYSKRATKKGSLSMPSDKMLFQLGRMNHMITSCVQCGQCLEACPNDVPYLRQFPYMAKHIQKVFEYEAGRNLEEPLPLADFKEDELYPK